MSQVEFEEQGNEYQRSRSFVAQELSGIAKFIIKLGIAKNESQAKIVMVAVTIVCFGITIFIVFFSGSKPPPPPTWPTQTNFGTGFWS